MAGVLAPRPADRMWTPAPALGAMVAAVGAALVAAAMPGWSGVLSLLWLAVAVVAWRWPVVGLMVVALAVPFEQRLALPTIAGDLTPMAYTVWACSAGSVPRLVRERRGIIDQVAIAHLAVVVVLVASIGAGGVRVQSWWETIHAWVLALLVYVIARSLAREVRDRLALVAALAAGVLVNAVMAAWQLATGAGPESFVVGGVVRVFGAFFHPNTLAAYLAFLLPMLVAVSVARGSRVAWLARLGVVAGAITLLLTQSRGGLLAFACAIAVVAPLLPRRVQRCAAFGVVAVALALAATGAIDRVPGIDRFSSIAVSGDATQVTTATWGQREREAHWGAAWSMLRSDPLFGVGAGEFNDHYREHTPEWRFRVGRGHAHNGYLQLGAEAGVPGLAAFALWVGTIVIALWRRTLRARGMQYWLALGALGGAVAWAVDNTFEYQEVPSILVMFVLLIALGLSDAVAPRVPGPRREASGGSAS